MIITVLFSLIVYSGGFISYALGNKRILRVVPLSLMIISLVLFIFGLLGQLKYGVICVLFITVLFYCIGGIKLYKNRGSKRSILDILKTFGFVIVLLVVISLLDRGIYMHTWDDFSHWGDVVKAMFYIDDFATNPLSQSRFQDYPPGMALLQYLFLSCNSIVNGSKIFVEGHLFVVLHFFVFTLLFPLFDNCSGKKLTVITVSYALILVSCYFFYGFFECLYIDQVVSVVAAFLMCNIMFSKDKDKVYDLSIIFGCGFLVLLKDIGSLFAVGCGLVYLFDKLFKSKSVVGKFSSSFPLLVVLFMKFLWNRELVKENVSINFTGKINLVEYYNLLIYKNGKDNKQIIVNSAAAAFFDNRFHIGNVSFSYFSILLLSSIFVICLIVSFYLMHLYVYDYKSVIVGLIVSTLIPLFYSMFIGAIYVYKFSEYEALRLASYERYMNMCFLFYSIIIICTIYFFISCLKRKSFISLLSYILLFIVFINNSCVKDFLSRNNITKGESFRNKYVQLVDSINSNCCESDVIAILSRGDNGLDRYVMRYYCRPIKVNIDLGYSLGGPSFDGDIWYSNISPDEYMNSLIDNEITYVAILQTSPDFNENYGCLFENANDIDSNALFQVDVSNRILVKCDN